MSQQTPGTRLSILGNESITAYRVVAVDTDRTVRMWDTSTSNILGVSADFGDSSSACQVLLNGTAKVQCALSVGVGAIVGPSTDSNGQIVERVEATTTSYFKTLGIALESGSTNSVIEVALFINNRRAAT